MRRRRLWRPARKPTSATTRGSSLARADDPRRRRGDAATSLARGRSASPPKPPRLAHGRFVTATREFTAGGRKDFLIDGKAACVALGEIDFGAAPRADVYALSKEEAPTAAIVRGPASRKLLFAAAAYGSEVLQVMQDIWHG